MKYRVKWKRTIWYDATVDVEPDELAPGDKPEQAAYDYAIDDEDSYAVDGRTTIISVKKVE